MTALLVAVEAGKVALDKGGEASGAGTYVVRRDIGLLEKGESLRLFQESRHEHAPSAPEGHVSPSRSC